MGVGGVVAVVAVYCRDGGYLWWRRVMVFDGNGGGWC
jgi:hypothetical protein